MWFQRRNQTRTRLQTFSGPGILSYVLTFGEHKVRPSPIESDGLLTQVECSQSTLIPGQVSCPHNEIAVVQNLPRGRSGLVNSQDIGVGQQAQGVWVEKREIGAHNQRTARHGPEAHVRLLFRWR